MQEENTTTSHRDRAITPKSLLFGLLGILVISGLAGFHDGVITGNPPMIGTYLPPGPYLFIALVVLVWNLIFSRAMPALVLSSRELVVVMCMTLMACFPPTSGLFRYFQRQLTLPWYYLASGGKADWQKFGLLDYLPAKLFPHPVPSLQDGILALDDTVYRGFISGLAQGNRLVGLGEVPWGAWMPPLLYWGPLIVLVSICVMSLSLLVHEQWAHHEQLSYPLVQVASAFLSRRRGKGVPDVFRTKLFWWGFLPIFTLYFIEYAHQWFPEVVPGLTDIFPNIKTWNINITQKMPILWKAPSIHGLRTQTIFFSIIGIAYFVSSEISLSMGLSHIILTIVGVWFFLIVGTPIRGQDINVARGGAYIGYALILLYTGRTYYISILKKAFRTGGAQDREKASVLAARLLMLSFAGFVAMLVVIGVDWLIALFFALLLMLMFLVFTRIVCETGIPFMQTSWVPGSLLVSIMGPAAIGPGPMVFILYLGTILCQDPRECLMPYVATSIKLADDANLGVRRVFGVLVVAVLIALVVGFTSTTWTMYNYGSMSMDAYSSKSVPNLPFDNAARDISELHDTGMLQESASRTGLGKLGLFSPKPGDIAYLLVGLGVVIAFSAFRFRFSKFPLHPVLFLVIGTYPAWRTWWSFLVGWAVKGLVVHFGGGKVYQNLKPIFIGVIAGELIAVGVSILVDMIYYWITGEITGLTFNVMVG